jgi:purine-binding chemotaxis protein CheW
MKSEQEEILTDEPEDDQNGKFLIFSSGSENYGIEIRYVKEIISLHPITEVPEVPGYIRGIINLRGQIIPVMDIRLRFRKPFMEYNDRTCIIVIDIEDFSIGLIVDSVSEVVAINEEEIIDPPKLRKENNPFIKAIGKIEKEVKLIIDSPNLVYDADWETLKIG